MTIGRFLIATLLAGLVCSTLGTVRAQDYPKQPLRIYTSDPGGGTDLLSRILAQGISGPLGQPVIVENRGGNVVITAGAVAKAPPDGYTLLVWAQGVWLAQYLESASYDPLRDLSPITLAVMQPSVVVIHPAVPAKSIPELIAVAKARPGELNYAGSGIGGTTQLSTELLKSMAGVNIVRVNYKSTGAGLLATAGGETQLMLPTANAAMPHVKQGKLRALAVTSVKATALVPGLPAVAETLPGYEAVTMTGVFAPSKTPSAVITRLHQEMTRVLTSADVKEKFFNAGSEVVANTPEQFAAAIKVDMARWAKVIKDAGIRME